MLKINNLLLSATSDYFVIHSRLFSNSTLNERSAYWFEYVQLVSDRCQYFEQHLKICSCFSLLTVAHAHFCAVSTFIEYCTKKNIRETFKTIEIFRFASHSEKSAECNNHGFKHSHITKQVSLGDQN